MTPRDRTDDADRPAPREGGPGRGASGKGGGKGRSGKGRSGKDGPGKGRGGRKGPGGGRPGRGGPRKGRPGRGGPGKGSAGRGKPRGGRPAKPAGPRPIVVVFARAPEPGAVKTRLTAFLRAAEAADLHRALLLDTVEAAESSGAEVAIAFTPQAARRELERLLGRHRRLLPQGPGDLGRRLAYGFERLCDGRRPVLAVGSDCPGLSPARIREAAEALGRADVVLGPAADGGYYLIGSVQPRPDLFEGVAWGTGRVLEATMEAIGAAGLRARLLPAERDLDTPEDLFELWAGTRTATWADAYPRTWKTLHALLPPRRLSMLEEAVTAGREDR